MNHSLLNLDLEADAIARAARRKRRVRFVKFSALPLLILGYWFFLPAFQGDQSPPIAKDESSKDAQQVLAKNDFESDSEIPPTTTIIESEDELLAILEEFGPVITEYPDGSSYLILTSTDR